MSTLFLEGACQLPRKAPLVIAMISRSGTLCWRSAFLDGSTGPGVIVNPQDSLGVRAWECVIPEEQEATKARLGRAFLGEPQIFIATLNEACTGDVAKPAIITYELLPCNDHILVTGYLLDQRVMSLTAREIEVMATLFRHGSVKAQKRLGIKYHTLESHKHNIATKLKLTGSELSRFLVLHFG
jgi:DNA-binding CsgD family transcriptional regulator